MKSLLVVDDDREMSECLGDVLQARGYQADTANSGLEALMKVREKCYDAILMDILMPELDGVETFKKLKGICSNTAVIMMTAFSVEPLVNEALREGALSCLYKPLDIDKVFNLLEKV